MKKSTLIAGMIAIFIWATVYSFSKYILQYPDGSPKFGVFPYLTLRMIIGLSFLWIVLIATKKTKQIPRIYRENKRNLWFLGIIAFGFSYIIEFYAVKFTTSVNVSILIQIQTFFVILVSAIMYKNKISPFVYLGCLLSFIGFLMIMANKGFSFSTSTLIGDLLTLASAVGWGFFTGMSGKVVQKNDRLVVLVIIQTIGAIPIIPLGFFMPYHNIGVLKIADWSIMIWLGVMGLGVAYILWFKSLNEAKSEEVAILLFITPVFSYTLGYLLLGETISLIMVIGTILILIGIYLAEASESKLMKLMFTKMKFKKWVYLRMKLKKRQHNKRIPMIKHK